MHTVEELQEIRELEAEIIRQRERLLYKGNLYELSKLIGFTELGEFHKDLCERLVENKHKRQLYLLPRGHFKTSVITIANSVRLILENPDVRILIASSTGENAKKALSVIKNVFWSNPEFRRIFPEYCPPESVKDWGTQYSFTVPNRVRKIFKEGTVETTGVGNTIIGRHYDYIIFSDIVTPDTVTTRAQIDKTEAWCKTALSLFNNPSNDTLIIEGTRYHHDDYHGHIEEQARKHKGRYSVYKRPAIEKRGDVEVALFPELWLRGAPESNPVDAVKQILMDQGSYIFSGQYMLLPIDEATAAFRRGQIQYLPQHKCCRDDKMHYKYPTFMAIDPALSEDPKSDHSVITVSTFDTENNEYIIQIDKGHWNPMTLVQRIFANYDHFQPISVGIETVAFQKLLAMLLDEVSRSRGVILPIREISRNTNKTKNMRIMALQPRFEQKRIWFADNLDKGFIEDQILRFNQFSKNNRDDLLDTLADLEDVKMLPEAVVDNVMDKYPMMRWKRWIETPAEFREDYFDERHEEKGEYYAPAAIGNSFNP